MTDEELNKYVERAFVIAETPGSDWQEAEMSELLRSVAARAREEALEEAALFAEGPCPDVNCCGPGVAAAIRALKESPAAAVRELKKG